MGGTGNKTTKEKQNNNNNSFGVRALGRRLRIKSMAWRCIRCIRLAKATKMVSFALFGSCILVWFSLFTRAQNSFFVPFAYHRVLRTHLVDQLDGSPSLSPWFDPLFYSSIQFIPSFWFWFFTDSVDSIPFFVLVFACRVSTLPSLVTHRSFVRHRLLLLLLLDVRCVLLRFSFCVFQLHLRRSAHFLPLSFVAFPPFCFAFHLIMCRGCVGNVSLER